MWSMYRVRPSLITRGSKTIMQFGRTVKTPIDGERIDVRVGLDKAVGSQRTAGERAAERLGCTSTI